MKTSMLLACVIFCYTQTQQKTQPLPLQEWVKRADTLFVKIPCHTVTIDINKNSTIKDVKDQLKYLAELPVEQQVLCACYKSIWSLWIGVYKSHELPNECYVKHIMNEFNTQLLELSVKHE